MKDKFIVELRFPMEVGRKLAKYAALGKFPTLSAAVAHLVDEGVKAKEAESRKNFDPGKAKI